jgi:hypothetical protein
VVGRYHDTVVESECWISGARSWSKVYGGGLRKTKRDAMHCPFEPLTQPIAPLKHTESIHSFFRATTQWNQDPSPQPPLLETTNLVESRPAAAASAAQTAKMLVVSSPSPQPPLPQATNPLVSRPAAAASAAQTAKMLVVSSPSPQPPLPQATNPLVSRPAAAASAAQNDEPVGSIKTRRRSRRCSKRRTWWNQDLPPQPPLLQNGMPVGS